MIINKNSWHYRFWRWTHTNIYMPRTTNLCSYVQRIFWLGLISIVAYTAFAPVYIWFARPSFDYHDENPLVPWKSLGYIKSVPIYPAHIFFLALLGLGEYFGWTHHSKQMLNGHCVFASMILFIGLMFLTVWLDEKYSSQEPGVIRSWLSAKKAGVCPLIEFSGTSNTNNNTEPTPPQPLL